MLVRDFKAAQPMRTNVMEKLSWLLIYAVHLVIITEEATRSVLWNKVFLEISQNSQENTCARVNKVAALRPTALL